jgi:NADH:ubiquinone oxidoreductase subunit 3 (subunit A)
MFIEYVIIFKYFLLASCFVLLLFSLSFFLVYQLPEAEKFSSYECGFNPFGDAREKFEVRFYLVGVLFLIFDLEISFLFPWIIGFNSLHWLATIMMLFFLFILSLGFWYEWAKGALEWE